jgi:osmotically-inducible protein OsmY
MTSCEAIGVLPALAKCYENRELAGQVKEALRQTGYAALRAVRVFTDGQVLVLQGRVPSYHLKQVAQTAAMDVAGVREMHNELEVSIPFELSRD